MLVNMTGPLERADKNGCAIAAINVYDAMTIRSAVRAAAKVEAPVILAFGASYLTFIQLDEIYGLAEFYSRSCDSDIVLHLDHCSDIGVIESALQSGFTSVMIDGSRLPFKENLRVTKEAVKLAKSFGATVEAELGSLATGMDSHEGELDDREIYTDSEQACHFVKKSGVDALAVSIGTVHGMYKKTPDIRVDILKEIKEVVPVPLVLHGASGTAEDCIRSCIENGIRKINVNTEISLATMDLIRSASAMTGMHLSELVHKSCSNLEENMVSFIRRFTIF